MNFRRSDQKLRWLRAIPGFEVLSAAEIRLLGATADRTTRPAGTRLITQGHRGLECFVIAAGFAQVVREGDHVATIGPGSVVGELALLDGALRNADVIATTDLELAVFDTLSFRTALTHSTRFGAIVSRLAADHRAQSAPRQPAA